MELLEEIEVCDAPCAARLLDPFLVKPNEPCFLPQWIPRAIDRVGEALRIVCLGDHNGQARLIAAGIIGHDDLLQGDVIRGWPEAGVEYLTGVLHAILHVRHADHGTIRISDAYDKYAAVCIRETGDQLAELQLRLVTLGSWSGPES